ncbi:hypothetical protein RN001_014161 [Aquatica leii]|uniref:Major facilitator superfamily (MFS) profile domain-containing protein n=1 Tax=Aquatica leii TaxID=1421715 RepID=A0AAN7S7D3_9COLE|nr:hypothetical protein RN001_014161 [Aquatica leii]
MITGWNSPAIAKLTSDNSPIGVTLSNEEASWVTSVPMLGFIVGSVSSIFLLTKFGPKKTLIIAALPIIISWMVIAFTKSVKILIAMRCVAGFGDGFIITALPLYIGEVTDKDIRGGLTTTISIMNAIGNVVVYSVGPFISYMALALLCGAVPLFSTSVFMFMPDSPYFLCKKGKLEESKKNLKRLIGGDLEEKDFINRLSEIEATVAFNKKSGIGLRDVFKKRNYRRAIILIAGLKVFVHLSGISAVRSYLQTIIDLTGSSVTSEISSIIFGVVQIPPVLLAAFLMDRVGRKKLYVISAAGCVISLISEGVYFYLQESSTEAVAHLQWLPTLCLTVYLVIIPIGVTSVPYVITGELLASEVKSVASPLTTTIGAAVSFFTTRYFLPFSDMVGMHTMFFIYAGCCTMASLFVIFVLPETKGQSFLEIQEVLKTKSYSAWLATSSYMINSWSSPALVQLTSENSPIGVTLNTIETSWVVSAPMLGFIIGAMSLSWCLSKFGLKKTLIIGALPVILSWIVIACTKSVTVLITMRWITGFGEGFIITTVPLYIGEVSDKDIRGRLTTTITMMSAVGNVLVYSVGPFVSYMALTLLCAAVPLITTTIFVFMPESPYFLCKKGRLEESKNSLKRLIGSNLNENAFTKRFLDIQATVFSNNKTTIGLRDLCRTRNYRRAIILIIGLKLFVHLSGLSAIKSHLQKVIELAGSSISSEVSSIIFGFVQLPSVLIAGYLMDKTGRKKLYIVSAAGCALSLICVGAYFYLQESPSELSEVTAHLRLLPTLCLTMYLVMLPIGVAPVPYVVTGEILASEVKSVAAPITTATSVIVSFFSTKYFLLFSNMFGMHTMLFGYGGCCIMACIFVIVVLPETKGKSFLEIQKLLKTRSYC